MESLIHPLTLLAIIFVGYGFKRGRIVGDKDYRVLQRIVFNLTLPASIIVSFATNPHDVGLLWISLFGFVCAALPIPFLYLSSHRRPVGERAFLMLNGVGFNVGNFCFPMLQGMMGAQSIVVGAMFDIGNNVVVSAGNNLLTQRLLNIDPDRPLSEQGATDAPTLPRIRLKDKDARRLARRHTIRGIVRGFVTSVSFDTYIVMIALMVAGIALPAWIPDVLEPVANANAFCSMLMVGMLMDLPGDRHEAVQVLRVIGWRIPFGVVFALVSWFLLPFDPMVRKALVLLSLAPSAVFGTLYSDRVLGNARMAGFCLALTAIIAIVLMSAVNVLIAI